VLLKASFEGKLDLVRECVNQGTSVNVADTEKVRLLLSEFAPPGCGQFIRVTHLSLLLG
jgi:hypothetical protein